MFIIKGKTYDLMKRLVQVILPAASSLYFGLAAIWHLPGAEQVVGTLALIATFLGVSLGISSSTYKKSGAGIDGQMIVSEPEKEGGPRLFSLEINAQPEDLEKKDSITLKVKR